MRSPFWEVLGIKIDEVQDQQTKYIQDGQKIPLDYGRLGYLTLRLSILLKFNSNDCFINRQLKSDCLLRQGTYNKKDNSFLMAISTIFGYSSVNDMIKVIFLCT